MTQSYGYDKLNLLASAAETAPSLLADCPVGRQWRLGERSRIWCGSSSQMVGGMYGQPGLSALQALIETRRCRYSGTSRRRCTCGHAEADLEDRWIGDEAMSQRRCAGETAG